MADDENEDDFMMSDQHDMEDSVKKPSAGRGRGARGRGRGRARGARGESASRGRGAQGSRAGTSQRAGKSRDLSSFLESSSVQSTHNRTNTSQRQSQVNLVCSSFPMIFS